MAQKTPYLVGMAAAGALIGAAVVYHLVSGRSEACEDEDECGAGTSSSLQDELVANSLDKVAKAGNELDPGYMLKLMNFVTQTARGRRSEERSGAISARREAYKSKDWSTYRQLVKEQCEKDDQMCQVVIKEVLELLGDDVSEQLFYSTMHSMASNPQHAHMLMAAQQGKLPSEDQLAEAKRRPKLEKAKTLKAFEATKNFSIDALKQQQAQMKRSVTQSDESEQMVDLFVDQAKMEDAIWLQEGVTNEDVEQSMMFFLGQEDPDVKKAMIAYSVEMQAMQGSAGTM